MGKITSKGLKENALIDSGLGDYWSGFFQEFLSVRKIAKASVSLQGARTQTDT